MSKQLLEQLGQQQLKKLCQEHGEEEISYCLTDGLVICNECYFEEEHKGHKIQSIKKAKQEAETKIKDLKEIQRRFDRNT